MVSVIIAIIAFAAFCYFVVKVQAVTLFHNLYPDLVRGRGGHRLCK
jgi:hypothetical protein